MASIFAGLPAAPVAPTYTPGSNYAAFLSSPAYVEYQNRVKAYNTAVIGQLYDYASQKLTDSGTGQSYSLYGVGSVLSKSNKDQLIAAANTPVGMLGFNGVNRNSGALGNALSWDTSLGLGTVAQPFAASLAQYAPAAGSSYLMKNFGGSELPIVVDSSGKPAALDTSRYKLVDTGAANAIGVFDSKQGKLIGTTWRASGTQVLNGNGYNYTDSDLNLTYDPNTGSPAGSRTVFQADADGNLKQVGAYIYDQKPADWSTSNRNAYFYRQYNNADWLKQNAKSIDGLSGGFFLSTDSLKNQNAGWTTAKYDGGHYDTGMGGLGAVLSIGLALSGVGGVLAGTLGGGALGAAGAGAIIGGTTAAITGGDVLNGALGGAIGGALTGSGALTSAQNATGSALGTLSDLGNGSFLVNNAIGQAAIDAGVKGAVSGAVSSALNGAAGFGSVLQSAVKSGLASAGGAAASAAVKDAVSPAGTTNTQAAANYAGAISGAAGGGASGIINAALTGGNVAKQAIVGAAAGGAAGLASDLGASGGASSSIGKAAGSLVQSGITDTGSPIAAGGAAASPGTATASASSGGGLSFGFGDILASNSVRRDMNWGSRLNL